MRTQSILWAFSFLVIFAVSPVRAQNYLTNGLVAFYPLDGSANNAVGTNHGIINGAILTQNRFAVVGSAYNFNGVNSRIDFAAPPITNVANWTVSAWIKPANFTQQSIAVQIGFDNASTGNGYGFGFVNSSTWTGIFSGVGGGWIGSGQAMASTNDWYHVVMLRDATTTRFYINGIQTPTTYAVVPKTPTDFTIGSQNGLRFFNGSIDDVRVYNRALSPQEISQLYGYENSLGKDFLATGLIAFYPFNGNANDAAGTNHGTVFGATLASDMFGNPDQAYSFNGLNTYIRCSDAGFPAGNAARTVSLWVYFRSYGVPSPNNPVFISYGSGGANDTYYAILYSSQLNNPIKVGKSGGGDAPSWPGTKLGQWYHVAFSHDGVNATKLYINGVFRGVATRTYSTTLNNKFFIDQYTDVFGTVPNPHDGLIDNVRVYNRALSTTEISQLYAVEGSQIESGIITLPTITIEGVLGTSCRIEYKNDVNETSWMTLVTNLVLTNNFVLYPDTSATNQPKRFYRVLNN